MNEKLEAFKNVWATLIGIGWNPWPAIIAAAVMIGGRAWFEPDVLDVNSPEAKKRAGWIKLGIILATILFSIMAHMAITRPKDAYDVMMSIVMSAVNSVAGYVIYSIFSAVNPVGIVVGIIRRLMGQEQKP